jgi:putative ABC transport system permease protein
MNPFHLILKNLRHYHRSNLNVLLGAALSAGILIAALSIGSSVNTSLENIVKFRLGNTGFVVSASGKLFPQDLATRFSAEITGEVAPVLQLRGIVSSDSLKKRLSNIQVLGVDERFWQIGQSTLGKNPLQEDEVIINQQLASEAKLKIGDELVLRIEKASFVPLNAPFVPDDKNYIIRRLAIKAIAGEKDFGDFNLQKSQIQPQSVFLSLNALNKLVAMSGQSNILLIENTALQTSPALHDKLQKILQTKDLGISFKKIENTSQIELATNRIFIDDTLSHIFKTIEPSAQPVFTYFFNALQKNEKETPYSFVSAPENEITSQLTDNEIIINDWVASDIQAKSGDSVTLKYYEVGPLKELKEVSKRFIVRQIVPLSGKWADRSLMPEFEGLSKVDNCKQWEAGIPVNFDKIRDKDEDYWKKYRGTPKAFVSLSVAQKLWSNSYGNCTAVRFSGEMDTLSFKTRLMQKLTPELAGFSIISVAQDGLWAANNALDFSGLFLSLSFFVIVAAIILISLLFSYNLQLRAREFGVLLSLGILPTKVKQLIISENLILAILGSFVGIVVGVLFNHLVLIALNSIWADIVRTNSIAFHLSFSDISIGVLSNVFIAWLVIFLVIRKRKFQSISNLQKSTLEFPRNNRKTRRTLYFLLISLLIIGISGISLFINDKQQNPALFFIIGTFTIIGSLSAFSLIINKLHNQVSGKTSWLHYSFKALFLNRKKNMALAAMLSVSTFMILATSLNRTDFYSNARESSSGTGAYTFYAETTLPVLHNLNSKTGQEKYGLADLTGKVRFLQMHLAPGDDASCLNLNRIANPRIVSVNPQEFISRHAFSFASKLDKNANPWQQLTNQIDKHTIPAIADQTVIQWGLGKSVGDTLKYVNEKGDTIHLQLIAGLANSVFQGSVLISEENFKTNFPSIDGTKLFLAECKKEDETQILSALEENFQNLGIEISYAWKRLEMFNSITNTYLDIFLALGGLGLLIGTFGIAIILRRNLIDRKKELALMQAIGLRKLVIFIILMTENSFVVVPGLFAGLIASLISAVPSLVSQGAEVPYKLALGIFTILIICTLIIIAFSIYKALQSNFREELRNE